jgi:hypothetical protein
MRPPLGDAFLLLGFSARLGFTILAWDEYARCWHVSQLCLFYICTCFTERGGAGGATQNGKQVSKTSHLSGEGDLQVSLCSVYPFSRFIQSSVAEAYLVFPYSLPSRGASKSLRSATDRGVFRSMLEFQVTGDGAWFLHVRFAG